MNINLTDSDLSNFSEYIIMLIDDNLADLSLMTYYLEEYGFKVITAQDSEIALQKIETIYPNLILLDIVIPGLDGFEICCQLKQNEATRDIPVIFITALTSPEHKLTGFEAGGVDYITKPVEQREVLVRVMTHLRIQDQAKQVQGQARQLQVQAEQLQEQNEFLQAMMADLEKSNEALSRLAGQLEISSQVGQQVTSILEVDELLTEVANSIQIKFGYYFVGIWLLGESSETLMLYARAGQANTAPLEKGTMLSLEKTDNILVKVCRSGEDNLINDISSEPHYFAVKKLPDTRSELALPLRFAKNVIGVLDIQSDQVGIFNLDDRTVLQILANQTAVAIRNAQLYSLVQKANADKDKFFSIVAHDVKGPFMPLLGMSELLAMTADTLLPKEVREMGLTIHQSAKNVYNLLENLLQWSRMQMGRIEYRPIKLDLFQVVEQTIELLMTNALSKGIFLQNRVMEGLFVYADENMLNVVVRNLTSNALKFTPHSGQVIVAAGIKEQRTDTQNQKFIEVAISDTGVGMKEADIAKLFRIEVHHSTVGTNREKGTGLGLIICKEMVEKNGGQIWVESGKGQGTTVKFTVPLDSDTNINLLNDFYSDNNSFLKPVINLPLNDHFNSNFQIQNLVALPPKDMGILLDLARSGNLLEIEKQAVRLKQFGEYAPFASKLHELAKGFEEQAILELLTDLSTLAN